MAGLYLEHERILLSNAWLDDKLVNAGQTLLKARFPNIHGFQDVSLGQTLAFNIVKEGFVQVLHTGRGHWVTVSTIGCSTAEVTACHLLSAVLYRTKWLHCSAPQVIVSL